MNKYKAKRTSVGGITFASKKEAAHFQHLKIMQNAGLIHSLTLQPEFPVWINGTKCFVYKGDFSHMENGNRIITDVKGVKTPVYRIKKKCVEAYYRIKIREI